MPFTVYILFSEALQKYYTGSTADLLKRINDHNQGWSKHTSKGIPWILVYSENFETRRDALQRENAIKKRGAKRFLADVQ